MELRRASLKQHVSMESWPGIAETTRLHGIATCIAEATRFNRTTAEHRRNASLRWNTAGRCDSNASHRLNRNYPHKTPAMHGGPSQYYPRRDALRDYPKHLPSSATQLDPGASEARRASRSKAKSQRESSYLLRRYRRISKARTQGNRRMAKY